MSRKKIILIWIICLSPFLGFTTLIYLVKINTIVESNPKKITGLVSFSDLENPVNNLATVVYSSDSVELGKYYKENRQDVHYTKISPVLIDALISTEDVRFKKHSGIDVRSLFRASYGALSGNYSGGGSTITQQLSKMLFTQKPSSGIDRIKQKQKEWIVAIELEKRYSKNEIIEMYLNRFDWINQAVGISSASKIYFNTKQEKLTKNQAAMLVGMLKNPSLYNPIRNPEGTRNRRNVVLSQMLKYNPCKRRSDSCTKKKCYYNKITQHEFDSLKVLPLGLDFQKTDHNEGPAPYFREQLRLMLKEWCSTHKKPNGEYYNLYTDGLIVYTTIDTRIQKHAEQAVKDHLTVLQKEFYEVYEGKRTPYPREFSKKEKEKLIYKGVKRSERYRKLKKRGTSEIEIEDIFNTKVKTKLFSWQGEIDTLISPKDSVIYNKFFLHTGVMSMDPNTGHVKAYVGGINHKYFQYDHVLQGTRQVGSTFKPFLYSLAIQEGMEPCDKIFNSPVIFYKDEWNLQKDYKPKNSSPQFNELNLSLKFGLANSLNMMTASIMKDYGPQAVINMAQKMGVTSPLPNSPSLCLGPADMSVKEITAAYSTFVNQGVYTEPLFITRIVDKNGVVLENFSSNKKEALNAETAAIMVELLKGVVQGVRSEEKYLSGKNKGKTIGNRGTGMRLRGKPYNIKSGIGGKTGTTQDFSDGWFVGITPNLVTAVWVGCEDRDAHFNNRKGYGSHMALPIFGKFMRYVYDDLKQLKEDRKEFLANANKIKDITVRDQKIKDINKKYDALESRIIIREGDRFLYPRVKDYIEKMMNCDQNNDIIFDEDEKVDEEI